MIQNLPSPLTAFGKLTFFRTLPSKTSKRATKRKQLSQ